MSQIRARFCSPLQVAATLLGRTGERAEGVLFAWCKNFLGTGRHGKMQFRTFLLTFGACVV